MAFNSTVIDLGSNAQMRVSLFNGTASYGMAINGQTIYFTGNETNLDALMSYVQDRVDQLQAALSNPSQGVTVDQINNRISQYTSIMAALQGQAPADALASLQGQQTTVDPSTPATTGDPATATATTTTPPSATATSNVVDPATPVTTGDPATAPITVVASKAEIIVPEPVSPDQDPEIAASVASNSAATQGVTGIVVEPINPASDPEIAASIAQNAVDVQSVAGITPAPVDPSTDPEIQASIAAIPPIPDYGTTAPTLSLASDADISSMLDAQNAASTQKINTQIAAEGNTFVQGVTGAVTKTQASATAQDQANFAAKADWRVRLSLAPGSTYLYNDTGSPANLNNILYPLKATDGVIFPYTPSIQVNYAAKYSSDTPTHSNYAINQYTSSSVDQVTIGCEFTAQDVAEANYLLAVIHFFRSMTKMFYGQDQNPKPGTPPPLCYMFGMGDYQFSAHPLAITNFAYSLPNDVDYIKTQGVSPAGSLQNAVQSATGAISRLGALLSPGGTKPATNYGASAQGASVPVTWVPTKIQISITCLPIISRNQISNQFSLQDYASGKLLNGTRRPGGGMW